MSNRKPLPGKFVWFELSSTNAEEARDFYRDVLGWNVKRFPTDDSPYEMIFAGATPDTMFGGLAPAPSDSHPMSHWIPFVSVDDVDRTAHAARAAGGKVIQEPHDLQGLGRAATIADPQGAELSLYKSSEGDPPDVAELLAGRVIWNELHTSDVKSALSFYEKVLGYSSRAMDMGRGGSYYIISRGVDRGGVTEHLPKGMEPHWLPYVRVDDPDAAAARAKQCGGTVPSGPEDIQGVGRIGVMADPTGAMLGFMKPAPRR
jgi:uncharacterized protein